MRLLIFLPVFFLSISLFAQDIVEWRGPNRSGVYPDQNLLKVWPEKGPKMVLEINNIGNGYSSPVVYKNVIFVTGLKDTMDVISAYDMTGQKKWETPYGRAWARTFPETRCTPTIENNRIYLVSGMGQVACADAVSGKLIWSVDAQNMFRGEPHKWGIAESAVISDKAVFYVTGGEETSVVALDKRNGNLLWKTKSLGGTRAYASSVIIEKAGLKLLLAQTARYLMGINTENGDIVWNFDLLPYHPGEIGIGANTNTPLYYDSKIFISSGYDHPGILLKLADDAKSVSVIWTNPDFDNHIGGIVKIDGYLFGSNWKTNTTGNWICVDWNTGSTMYETKWFNKGPVISANDMLYCLEEKTGNLALVKPIPDKFDVVSSFRIEKGTGPYWAHPAIFDGRLYVRHGEWLMVYDLKN